MLFLFLVLFSLCLKYSSADLYRLALEQGFGPDEAEFLRDYDKQDYKRQLNEVYRSKSGIPQTKICGINGKSASRLRRQENGIDIPQGSEDWPWMAVLLLKSNDVWFCGGALLNSRYILTAAHCFEDESTNDKSKFYVRLGEYELLESGETEIQTFDVEELIRHPDYQPDNQNNDITLLKLNDTVKYTQFVRPICLPGAEPLPNELTYVAGWGRTEDNATKSEVLLYVDVPIWDLDECKNAITDTVHDSNICAGWTDGGKDSCSGDSGGPLMYQRNGKRWENVGIVSWGYACASTDPAVYTSVSKFLPWIAKHILDASP